MTSLIQQTFILGSRHKKPVSPQNLCVKHSRQEKVPQLKLGGAHGPTSPATPRGVPLWSSEERSVQSLLLPVTDTPRVNNEHEGRESGEGDNADTH